MIYQALLWRALFFVHAHLDSRVGYGGKWASNILVRILLLYSGSQQYLYSSTEPKKYKRLFAFLIVSFGIHQISGWQFSRVLIGSRNEEHPWIFTVWDGILLVVHARQFRKMKF